MAKYGVASALIALSLLPGRDQPPSSSSACLYRVPGRRRRPLRRTYAPHWLRIDALER